MCHRWRGCHATAHIALWIWGVQFAVVQEEITLPSTEMTIAHRIPVPGETIWWRAWVSGRVVCGAWRVAHVTRRAAHLYPHVQPALLEPGRRDRAIATPYTLTCSDPLGQRVP